MLDSTFRLIDTHSHLYEPEFDLDRSEVIARAETAGVCLILLPAIDAGSYERQAQLAESRPDLFRELMGLHPTSVKDDFETALEQARQRLFACPDHYVGVGEIGLDLYWDRQFLQQQCEALDRHIGWAEVLD